MVLSIHTCRERAFPLIIALVLTLFSGCVVDESRMFQGVWRLSEISEDQSLHGHPSLGIGHYGLTATGLVWFHTNALETHTVEMCACQLIEQDALGTFVDLEGRRITFTSRCVTQDEGWVTPLAEYEALELFWDLAIVTLDDPAGRVMKGTVSISSPGGRESADVIAVRFISDRFGEMTEQDKQCRP